VLPPPPRRGLVLIDPAYEDKRDYARAVAAMKECVARFATGTFALWYPQLQRSEPRQLVERLKKLTPESWLHVALTVERPNADGFGMNGSGVFVINPPWTLAQILRDTMPLLAELLGNGDGAGFTLEIGQ
jgi:23S rRNA (adenine2030-N6)-methyltransferase